MGMKKRHVSTLILSLTVISLFLYTVAYGTSNWIDQSIGANSLEGFKVNKNLCLATMNKADVLYKYVLIRIEKHR